MSATPLDARREPGTFPGFGVATGVQRALALIQREPRRPTVTADAVSPFRVGGREVRMTRCRLVPPGSFVSARSLLPARRRSLPE